MSSNLEVLINLLQSGLTGEGAKQMLDTIAQYKADPAFCSLLANVFGAEQPVTNQNLGGFEWKYYRQQAGIALKNNIQAAAKLLGGDAVAEAATIVLNVLVNANDVTIGETACQVISKIVEVRGLNWWGEVNIDLANVILQQLLGSSSSFQVQLGLRCLKYILEDAGELLGTGAFDIIQKVTEVVGDTSEDVIRAKALEVLVHPYEVGKELNWMVDDKSDLQLSLMRAAPMVAYCSTAAYDKDRSDNNSNKKNAMRIWLYLTDYLDSLVIDDGKNQDQDNQIIECLKFWVNTTTEVIRQAQDVELCSLCCDILGSIAQVAATTDYEEGSVIIPVSQLVIEKFDTLLPSLQPCMIMKDDMIEHFVEKDDSSIRDERPKKYKRKFTVSENDDQDTGEVMTSLRDSAVDCLYNLAKMEPAKVHNLLIGDIQRHCSNSDWKYQEMAFTALGTIADVCCNELDNVYAELVRNLNALVQGGQAHRLVTSMALWCLIKMSDHVLNYHKNLTSGLLQTAIAAMPNNSKRIQCGATTLLKRICMNGSRQYLSTQDIIVPIIQVIHKCLPEYHTNNLALLADAAQELWGLLPDTPTLGNAVQPFIERLQELSNRFYTTAQQRYGQNDSNVVVDFDVIEVARAVGVAFMENIKVNPDTSNMALENLQSWLGVVDTIAKSGWDISDDPSLVGSPLHICNLMVQGLMPETYASVSERMVVTALECFGVDSAEVKGECIQACCDALVYRGLSGIPSIDAVVSKVLPVLHVETYPGLAVEGAGLLREMFGRLADENQMGQIPDSLVKATQMLAQQLRTDTHDADAHMTFLALHLACKAYYNPGMFSPQQLYNIIINVRGAGNDLEDKEQATEGICLSMSTMATQNRDAMPKLGAAFMRLVFSWQYAAEPSVIQNCGNIMRGLNDMCPDVVAKEMGKKKDSQKWIEYWKLN